MAYGRAAIMARRCSATVTAFAVKRVGDWRWWLCLYRWGKAVGCVKSQHNQGLTSSCVDRTGPSWSIVSLTVLLVVCTHSRENTCIIAINAPPRARANVGNFVCLPPHPSWHMRRYRRPTAPAIVQPAPFDTITRSFRGSGGTLVRTRACHALRTPPQPLLDFAACLRVCWATTQQSSLVSKRASKRVKTSELGRDRFQFWDHIPGHHLCSDKVLFICLLINEYCCRRYFLLVYMYRSCCFTIFFGRKMAQKGVPLSCSTKQRYVVNIW